MILSIFESGSVQPLEEKIISSVIRLDRRRIRRTETPHHQHALPLPPSRCQRPLRGVLVQHLPHQCQVWFHPLPLPTITGCQHMLFSNFWTFACWTAWMLGKWKNYRLVDWYFRLKQFRLSCRIPQNKKYEIIVNISDELAVARLTPWRGTWPTLKTSGVRTSRLWRAIPLSWRPHSSTLRYKKPKIYGNYWNL